MYAALLIVIIAPCQSPKVISGVVFEVHAKRKLIALDTKEGKLGFEAPSAKIKIDRATARFGDIKVGDRVMVTFRPPRAGERWGRATALQVTRRESVKPVRRQRKSADMRRKAKAAADKTSSKSDPAHGNRLVPTDEKSYEIKHERGQFKVTLRFPDSANLSFAGKYGLDWSFRAWAGTENRELQWHLSNEIVISADDAHLQLPSDPHRRSTGRSAKSTIGGKEISIDITVSRVYEVTAKLTTPQFEDLGRAASLEVRVGPTTFHLSPKMQDAVRSLIAAAKKKPATADDIAAPDIKQLQGTWAGSDWAFTFTGKGVGMIRSKPPLRSSSGRYTIDPAQRPKRIALPGNQQGLYRFEGSEKLVICFSVEPGVLPTAFRADPRSKIIVLELQRVRDSRIRNRFSRP